MAEQNIALNKPTSSSSFVKPYESARAVNGTYGATTPTSRWLCNTLPGWLMVDLGASYYINRWVVRHMPVAGWRTPDYNMCDFKLQGSNNNSNWYDIDGVVGNTVAITDRTFAAVAYRYVRLYVTKGLKCNTQLASAMEFEVYQSPPLSAYLVTGTGLTVSSGALTPAFVNNVFTYTTPNVAYSVTSVAVKPTAEDSRATIKVNDVVVTSGNSTDVALNVGSNAISIKVTAADGRTTNTYTVTVVRDATPPAYLKTLALATVGGVAVPYTPTPFDENTVEYSASVGYDVDKIVVTPTTDISGATITVKGVGLTGGSATVDLAVGSNAIPVVVTNGAGTKTYTVTVTRSSNTQLKNLVASCGLDQTFSKTVYNYTRTVTSTVGNVMIVATLDDTSASLTINSSPATSGSPKSITLTQGTNTIIIEVTPVTGTVKGRYTVTVTKP